MDNIIKVKPENIDLLTLSIGSFDFEIYNIIKYHKKLENLIIKLQNIPRHIRHRLHTFSRKDKVDIYSVSNENDDKRDMVIQLKKEYIDYIFKYCRLNQELKSKEEIKREKLEALLNEEFSKFKIELFEKIKSII